MYRSVSPRRRRRRRDSAVPPVAAVLAYAGLLVLINVRPGWEALPVLTSQAADAVDLLNLSLILCLVAQVIPLVGGDPRLRFGATYVIALVNLALIGQLWSVFPFDFGSSPDSWASATRMVLGGLLVWDLVVAMRAAVGIVRGRRAPRLAAGHI